MDDMTPQGEFHHFQLVNSYGEVPVSISVLVHYNQQPPNASHSLPPLETDDVIKFHEDLQQFNGDFITAFSASR